LPKSYFPFSKPDEKSATLAINKGGFDQEQKVPYDHAFVLVGAEVPVQFLKSLGIRMENEWIGSFWKSAAPVLATLVGLWYAGGQTGMLPETLAPTFAILGGALCLLAFAMLLILGMHGERCWAFRFWSGTRFTARNWVPARSSGGNWGYNALSFFDRPWSFWYTVLYTFLMTFFGIQALKRWGLDRKDRFQVWRFISLLAFQWIFFFIIPEFLFQWVVKYQWVGALANDPVFADQAWRSYRLIYAWPLFFYTFFYNPHQIWVIYRLRHLRHRLPDGCAVVCTAAKRHTTVGAG
jgi:hypothetical protein